VAQTDEKSTGGLEIFTAKAANARCEECEVMVTLSAPVTAEGHEINSKRGAGARHRVMLVQRVERAGLMARIDGRGAGAGDAADDREGALLIKSIVVWRHSRLFQGCTRYLHVQVHCRGAPWSQQREVLLVRSVLVNRRKVSGGVYYALFIHVLETMFVKTYGGSRACTK
jgi:hypothetical protein